MKNRGICTIAVLSNTSWSLFNFRLKLMQALEDSGYRILAVAPEDEYSKDIPFPLFPVSLNRRGTNPLQELSLIKQYKGIFKEQEVDLLLNFTAKPNIWGSLAASSLGIPCINNIAGLGNTFTQKGLLTLVMKGLYRFSQRKAKHIFFQNDDDLRIFQETGILKRHSYSLLPGSGVDTDRFTPVERKKNETGPLRFLMTARLLKHKGVFHYGEATEVLSSKRKDAQFYLLGPLDPDNPAGISEEDLKELCRSGNLQYLGETRDTKTFLAEADCFVLPSYYREGTPRSVLEALAMGLPVITTSMPGCRDTVEEGKNGFIIEPDNATALTHAMERMLELKPEERKKMGLLSRELAKTRFDEKLVIQAYKEVLNSIPAPHDRGR